MGNHCTSFLICCITKTALNNSPKKRRNICDIMLSGLSMTNCIYTIFIKMKKKMNESNKS